MPAVAGKAHARVELHDTFGVEIRIRDVEAVSRAIAERAEVEHVGRAEPEARVRHDLPAVVSIEYPANVAAKVGDADRCGDGYRRLRQRDVLVTCTQAAA